MVQHDEPVGDPHHRVHGVLDDGDGHAFLAQPCQHIQHLVTLIAAKPGQGLIQQQEPRPAGECARQLHQPELLVGEPAGRHVRMLLHPDAVQRADRGIDRLVIRQAGAVGADDDVSSSGRRGKLRTTWKVRPTPMRQTWCTLRPSMGWPARVALPSSALSTPFSRLNSVVLPAPFGPMMPRISPPAIEKVTSPTARRPPKERDNPFTSSSVAPAGLSGAECAGASCSGGIVGSSTLRNQRSRMVQNSPSGAAMVMPMIARPYTTPWMPGRILPSFAFSSSPSGTRIAAPITGPQIDAKPPNSVTTTHWAETSRPNTESGVTTSSTHA